MLLAPLSTAAAVVFFFTAGGIMAVFFAAEETVTTVVKVIHLLGLATSWGATVWAIFVGGLVMFMRYIPILYRNLPRHMMGSLRGKVFPACFRLTAACTGASAAAFAWLHLPLQGAPDVVHRQLVVLVAAVGFDLANLLIFTPQTLKMMQERHVLERSIGIGGQSFLDGWRSNVEAARSSAALAMANRRFRLAHVFSGAATLASAAGLAVHTCYLAGNLAL